MVVAWVRELLEPCFDCQPHGRAHRTASALQALHTPGHEVELVVSPLAGLRGAAGYHTSVVVDGEEYYFSPCGICCSPRLISHAEGATLHREFIGLSQHSGTDLLDFLTDRFRPCTYDLLRKNCNSFTDCALFFLCRQRLDPSFRQLEQFGRAVDDHVRIVQVVSRGEYVPNPRSYSFDLEEVMQDVIRSSDCQSIPDGPSWFDSKASMELGIVQRPAVKQHIGGSTPALMASRAIRPGPAGLGVAGC